MKNIRVLFHPWGVIAATLLLGASAAPTVSAAIAVQENLTSASNWPETPDLNIGNPGGTTGISTTPSTVISQTFTPTVTEALDSIYLQYSTAAASSSGSFSVRLQTVSGGSGAQTYTQGTNLLPSGGTFIFGLANTASVRKFLKLSFTGTDRVTLTSGTTYALEIVSTSSTVAFFRWGSSTYAGGAVYSNRSAVNYPSTRDISMAVLTGPAITGSYNIAEGITPADLWPEPLTVLTGDPADNTTGAGSNGSTIASQTFTPGRNFTLGTVYLSYSTSATSTANAFTLRLQTVPGGPAVSTYPQGTNLLGNGATPISFTLASTGGARRLLKIDLSGNFQVPLQQGTTYALEVTSTGSSISLYRRGAGTYSGGAYYSNRSIFNPTSTRDLAVGLVVAGGAWDGGVIGGSTYLPIPQNFSVQLLDGQTTTGPQRDQLAADGFKYFRKGIYWSRVERTVGTYDWAFGGYDSMISGYATRGLTPYITLFDGNSLYGESQRAITTAAGRAGFAEFARRTALHYPTVKQFEVWNEPNLAFFWAVQPSVQDYCDLVAAVAPAIRSVTPDAKIAGPALAGPNISFDWLEQAFQKGLLQYVDYIAVHPYRPGSTPPETALNEYLQLRAFINQYKPAGRNIEIVAGEWGYHTDNTDSGATQTVQAQYAVRMFLMHNALGMPFANWYSWKDGVNDLNNTDNYGLVNFSSVAKPSYTAVQTLATVLAGYTFEDQVPQSNPDVYLYKFLNSTGDAAYAVWTTGADVSVTIPTGAAGSGSLHDMLNATSAKTWGTGGLVITASQSPQYLIVN